MDPKMIAMLLAHAFGERHRLDAGETMLLQRQLEFVTPEIQRVLYDELKAQTFIPISRQVPPGAKTWIYRQYDEVGMAKLVANAADDAPLVDVLAREFAVKTSMIHAAYAYSVEDLMAAAMAGVPLTAEKAGACARAIARGLDSLACFGDTSQNLSGFLNDATVPTAHLTNGEWATATAAEILADLHEMWTAVRTNSRTRHQATQFILPTWALGRISVLNAGTGTDLTVLEYFLRNHKGVQVDEWIVLDDAEMYGASDAPIAVAYQKDPSVVVWELPLEYAEVPPEPRNLAMVSTAFAKHGGVCWKRPLAGAVFDNVD